MSNTDDLEAKAREWLCTELNTNDNDGDLRTDAKGLASILVAFARSLAQPKDPAPTVERIMEAITEVLQDIYGDDVLDWIERRCYTDKHSGITKHITDKLLNP